VQKKCIPLLKKEHVHHVLTNASGTQLRTLADAPAGIQVHSLPKTARHYCSFEWVYFGFPTSFISGIQVADFRNALGRALWQEHGLQTDVVVEVPDSSTLIGDGYIESAPMSVLDRSIIRRKHNTGRTFIISGQDARQNRRGRQRWQNHEGLIDREMCLRITFRS
jgi:glutamine phosphoribosylpyrophosphate amidotransferase